MLTPSTGCTAGALSAQHPSLGRLARAVFLLCRRRPRVMEEIRSMLHLDAMTVTGKTLGENLDALKKERLLRALRRAAARKNRTSEPQAAAHRHHPHVRKRQGHRRQHCHPQGQPRPRGAASSSTPPAPKRCFRSRCEQSPTTARKRASRPCCTATSAPATRSLSAMRVRAAAGCPRCSIPARPSAQTRRSLPA